MTPAVFSPGSYSILLRLSNVTSTSNTSAVLQAGNEPRPCFSPVDSPAVTTSLRVAVQLLGACQACSWVCGVQAGGALIGGHGPHSCLVSTCYYCIGYVGLAFCREGDDA